VRRFGSRLLAPKDPWNKPAAVRDYGHMECEVAREALSARIDGEREPIPAARVDEHVRDCQRCRQWQADAIEQTQTLRRLAGRSHVNVVKPPAASAPQPHLLSTVSWQRWALGAVGIVQLVLAAAQGAGAHLGVPHAAMDGHVLNESTAWSAALGIVMVAAAIRPAVAGGLMWVLGAFAAVLSVYVVSDFIAGAVTVDRVLTHLPVLAGVILAWLVWRAAPPGGRRPDHAETAESDEIVLPRNATRGRRRGHLRPSDGSAA